MSPFLPAMLVTLTAFLVFAAGWRMLPPNNSAAGGTAALLLFLLHPSVVSGMQNSSAWDAFFVMVFLTAWLWMQDWSLFMRSWVLAGIYAFGLWVGSPFALWGLVAMVPWVIFNRRPLPAVGSLVNVFFGGLFIFTATWGVAWFLVPNLGRPLFMQWIRWGGLKSPEAASLPWCLLIAATVFERLREMLTNRRSDASMFAAVLLVVTALFSWSNVGLAMIALSAPLIALRLAKREFLFHRRVRWVASATFVVTITLADVLRWDAWSVTGLSMLMVGLSAWGLSRRSRQSRFMLGEAVCVGAYVAESLATLLHLFPQ